MDVKRRLGILLAGTVLGTSFLVSAPAFADDAQLQQQINAMQQQLQVMQNQLAETKRQAKAAAQQAQETQAVQQQQAQQLNNIPPNLYAADVPIPTKGPPSWFDSVHVSMAGTFIELAGSWREHNESAAAAFDPPFSQIPFQNSQLYYQNQFALGAQQSRIAFKVTGDIDPAQHLKGYFESDFAGAGVTPNSRETNSYNPRLRQAFFEYDNDHWGIGGFHFVAGQSWSFITPNRVGLLPNFENTPLTIDGQNMVGWNWLRNPELRLVQDWGKVAWFGVAIANPQTNFVGNGAGQIAPAGFTAANGLVTPTTVNINPFNNCNASGLLNSTTQCSINPAPDIIEKFALDPGWGHYEAVGLQRWFADDTVPAVAGVAVPGNQWSEKVTFGWGVGGNALIPIVPKYLDLEGNVLYGQGIGRYGSSQLADVVVGPTGTLQPLTELQFQVGAVAHPWQGGDVYVYYGQEQANADAWTIKTLQGGYGNGAFPESCTLSPATLLSTDGTAGSANFNGSTALCTGNVQRVREITAGFWHDIYKGDLGRARVGVQYEYIAVDLFSGLTVPAVATNPNPNTGLHPSNNIVMFSFRYYPFN